MAQAEGVCLGLVIGSPLLSTRDVFACRDAEARSGLEAWREDSCCHGAMPCLYHLALRTSVYLHPGQEGHVGPSLGWEGQ